MFSVLLAGNLCRKLTGIGGFLSQRISNEALMFRLLLVLAHRIDLPVILDVWRVGDVSV